MTAARPDAARPLPRQARVSIPASMGWIFAMFCLQAAGLILAIGINVTMGADLRDPANANPVSLMFGVLVGNLILIGFRTEYLVSHVKRITPRHLRLSITAFLAAICLNWFYEAILIGRAIQPSNVILFDAVNTSVAGTIFVFLAVAISAPVLEEVLFRGQLQGAIESWAKRRGLRNPSLTALVVASATFGAIHFQPLAFPVLFTSGLAMGWIRQRTGSLTLPILMHIVMNTMGVLTLVSGSGS